MALQHLRSSTANKRPNPTAMAAGQVALNTATASPGVFFKDANDNLIKVGPVHVGTTAPNASPAGGGQAGNSVGEQWLDTSGTNPVLKIWDGSTWQSEAGEFVNASGDTMTGALVLDNQQQVRFREASANGTNFVAIQAPAAVAADRTLTLPDVTGTLVSTDASGNVNVDTGTFYVDATNDRVGVGTASPAQDLDVRNTGTAATIRIHSGTVSSSTSTSTLELLSSFSGSAVIGTARINANAPAGGQSELAFLTSPSSNSPTERMRISSTGQIILTRPSGSGAEQLTFNEGYSIYADNVGTGSANSRFWLNTPDGGELVLGPRAGAQFLHNTRMRSATFKVETNSSSNTLICNASGTTTLTSAAASPPFIANIGASEVARIDASGRLLVGATSTATLNSASVDFTPRAQIVGNTASDGSLAVIRTATSPWFLFGAGASGTNASNVFLGTIAFTGYHTDKYYTGASINASCEVATGAGNMPTSLRFSTSPSGSASPQERMRITSAGLVGIGTTSPSGLLHVNESDTSAGISYEILRLSSTSGGVFQIGIDDKTAANPTWRINTGGNEPLTFVQSGVNERMRITAAGNVGIGTSSPATPLDVNGSITGITEARDEASTKMASTQFAKNLFGAATTAGTLDWNDVSNTTPGTGTTLLVGTHTNGPGAGGYFHPVNFEYGNKNGTGNLTQFAIGYNTLEMYQRYRFSGTWTSWVRILNSNNFDLFALPLTGGTLTGALLGAAGTVSAPGVAVGNSADGLFRPASNVLAITTGGTERARIGSTLATFTTTVEAPTFNATSLTDGGFQGIATDTAASPSFTWTGDTNTGIFRPGTDLLGFSTAGLERARIDASGRLLLGTTAARTVVGTAVSQIETTAAYGLSIVNNNASANGAALVLGKSRSAAVGGSAAAIANDVLGYLRFAGADGTDVNTVAADIRASVDGTVSASVVPGRLEFLTATAAGSLSERARITSDGYLRLSTTSPGIQFGGDTAAANALDDYEEGTFTPTIIGVTTAGTGTYSVQSGTYTKIGNRVFFQCRLVWSAHTGTGVMRIDGLPFAAGSAQQSAVAIRVSNLTSPASTTVQGYVLVSSNDVVFESVAVAGGAAANLAIDTAADTMVSGHYNVA